MATKYIASIGEFIAISLEWNDTFDLSIYKDNEEIYRHNLICYSLNDVSKIVRRELNLPRKRIDWEVDNS